ncbi:hypothetical protein IT575_09970 [bacterium]|nr:hypothetical protein [bacterium]
MSNPCITFRPRCQPRSFPGLVKASRAYGLLCLLLGLILVLTLGVVPGSALFTAAAAEDEHEAGHQHEAGQAHAENAGHAEQAGHAEHEHAEGAGHEGHAAHEAHAGDSVEVALAPQQAEATHCEPPATWHEHFHDLPLELGLNVMSYLGFSDAEDAELEALQAGHHDPRAQGFSTPIAELSLGGWVTARARGQLNISFGEEGAELEEAYLLSQLGRGFELKAGQFYTDFGLHNARHPHSWSWMDQQLLVSRFFGSEGGRAGGVALAWNKNSGEDWDEDEDWQSRLVIGVQNAADESMVSFRGAGHSHGEEEEHGGEEEEEDPLLLLLEERYESLGPGLRPQLDDSAALLATLRWENTWQSESSRWRLGLSGMWGPNGSGAGSRTSIYGADLSYLYQPCPGEWPFVLWESEYALRSYDAAALQDDSDLANPIDLPALSLRDSAAYSQLLYGFRPQWAAGLRYEFAGSSGESVGGSEHDPLRDERSRISPLLAWYPSEATRVRLQYNHDDAQHLGRRVGSLWLGIDWSIGGHHHPAGDASFEVPGHSEEEHEHDHAHGHGHEHEDEHGHEEEHGHEDEHAQEEEHAHVQAH